MLQLAVYHQCIPQGTLHDEAKRSPRPKNQVLDKRQNAPPNFYPIIGAQSEDGQCYPRQNVEVLRTDFADQFNMLILAFDDLQKNPGDNSDLSWFGIGGIHGQPYIAWQQNPNDTVNPGLGYCIHSSPLFATWHRPYVLLLEQVLHERAVAVADRFLDLNRDKYVTAADQLRLPYMDWSDPAHRGGFPSSLSSAQIEVTRPSADGTSETLMINNPLYRYDFTSQELSQLTGRWGIWRYTTRNPDSGSPMPTSRDDLVNIAMMNSFTTRRQGTYNLFSMATFNSFSSQCEGIHNSIHGNIGGRGHMGSTAAASFDPAFWFHHSMVDRLIALYQVIHPTNKLTPSTAVATFGRVVPGSEGSLDDLDTRLYPFRMPNGAMYKSRDFDSGSTGIWKYKYGYPEIPCGDSTSPLSDESASQLSSSVRAAVNRLYGPEGTLSQRRRAAEPLPVALPEPHPRMQSEYTPSDSEVGLVRTEYSLRFFIDHSEITGLWACHVFLGIVPHNTTDYWTSPNRCGLFASFTAPGRHMESMPYAYNLAITDKLLELGVPSTETAVSAYLTQNLNYVITSESGGIIDPATLKTFKVGVCTWEGKYGKYGSDKLASFGDCRVLWKITEKKPGGVKDENQLNEPTLMDGTPEHLSQKLQTY